MKKIIVLFSLFIGAIFSPGALLAANNAEFISQNVPQTMTAGQTYQVSVAMKNTGTTAWTEADKFRLGSQNPQDNWIWREGRVYLAAGEEIAPGQTKTFNFDVKAPATPGAYNFQWRMVQEGVEWFGQISSNIVVNVIAGQVEIPLTGDLFDYAVFAGANVLERSTCWVPDENEADVIIKSAKKMRLRVLRLPILSQLADNADCWGLVNIKNFLDKADENGLKVIVVLNGYTKYEGYCGWQAGFVDVKDGAAKIVSALKNHPALFAWDLLNEPLWGADNSGCGSVADHQSTIKAVNAMHDLVRSIDSKTPLTVGEGKDEYLSQWNGIVNFASPHMYFGSSRMYTTGNEFRNRLDYCKSQVKNLPMVLGEFGLVVPDQATEEERAQVFGEIYRTLKQYNMGSMFWLLSTDEGNQGTMSLINANGSLKPTAEVVRQSFPSYNSVRFVSQTVPQTMTAGQTYQASIIMKNTGKTAWVEADKFRLGSQNPQDNWIWREGRVHLAVGESIAPGQTKTFNFDVKAPATPGTYNFQWQMVQDGVEWFGDKTPNVVVAVVSPAVCTPKTCAALGNYQCGSWSDGCGAMVSCGACTSGKTCNAGQCVSNCSSRAAKKCDGADLYWYNSCNAKEGLAQNCSAENKICRDGVCVSSGGGGGGGGGGIIEPQKEQPQKMTRAEILQKIAEVKQLLIQLIIQLIAELQKQMAVIGKN